MLRIINWALVLAFLAFAGCSSKKIVVKNCEKQNDGFYVCETP